MIDLGTKLFIFVSIIVVFFIIQVLQNKIVRISQSPGAILAFFIRLYIFLHFVLSDTSATFFVPVVFTET